MKYVKTGLQKIMLTDGCTSTEGRFTGRYAGCILGYTHIQYVGAFGLQYVVNSFFYGSFHGAWCFHLFTNGNAKCPGQLYIVDSGPLQSQIGRVHCFGMPFITGALP